MKIQIIDKPQEDTEEDTDDEFLFEPPKIPEGQRIVIREIEEDEEIIKDKPSNDKTPRRLNCPKCGHKMRRIYFKRNYTRKKGILLKKTKHSTIWYKLGWWCPYCDNVIIKPEYQP